MTLPRLRISFLLRNLRLRIQPQNRAQSTISSQIARRKTSHHLCKNPNMGSNRRSHSDKPLLKEHLRARFLVDLRANDTDFPDNPTKIDKPFWKYMVGHGSENAYHARKKFGVDPSPERWGQEPIFCFDRFGRTETRLPDGRLVYIGGEHEDFYDPDFCIYNDVVVVHKVANDAKEEAEEEAVDVDANSGPDADDDEFLDDAKEELRENLQNAAAAAGADPADIDMYGYPADVFPPTDFHTATYIKDEASSGKEYIYIIGGLGYGKSPHRTATLTHRLDLHDYSIQRVETTGEAPPPRTGGEREYKAELNGDQITYTVGSDAYVLSLVDMRWSRDRSSAAS